MMILAKIYIANAQKCKIHVQCLDRGSNDAKLTGFNIHKDIEFNKIIDYCSDRSHSLVNKDYSHSLGNFIE
jgi:hypothetical protein